MEEIAAGICSAVVVLLTEQLAGVSVGSRDGVCSPPGWQGMGSGLSDWECCSYFPAGTGALSCTRILFNPLELWPWRCHSRTEGLAGKTSVKSNPEFSALLFSMRDLITSWYLGPPGSGAGTSSGKEWKCSSSSQESSGVPSLLTQTTFLGKVSHELYFPREPAATFGQDFGKFGQWILLMRQLKHQRHSLCRGFALKCAFLL